MADELTNRRDELLKSARERLARAEESSSAPTPPPTAAPPPVPPRLDKLDRVPNTRGAAGRNKATRSAKTTTPTSRGRTVGRAKNNRSILRSKLEEVKGLYQDGLITRDEAERKRTEILDGF